MKFTPLFPFFSGTHNVRNNCPLSINKSPQMYYLIYEVEPLMSPQMWQLEVNKAITKKTLLFQL